MDMELTTDNVSVGKLDTSTWDSFPEYVGEMHLTDNFSVMLTQYPCFFHRLMIHLFFGWTFKRKGD